MKPILMGLMFVLLFVNCDNHKPKSNIRKTEITK